MTAPAVIDWAVAERVAIAVAGREPLADSYHYDSLAPDFARFTVEAEALVESHTGLRSAHGPARARVTDRAGWIRANVASFQRLLGPFMESMASKKRSSKGPGSNSRSNIGLMGSVGRTLAGAEVGALLGWMSTRVLGQYDMLVVENDDEAEQDIVYYVGPNILAAEKLYGLPPAEFRLWLALHELTHRAQFTGVPWLRSHFLSLLNQTLSGFEPDPKRLVEALRTTARQIRAGERLFQAGLVELLATPEQRQILGQVQGLMSVLEGHGDVVMGRAALTRVPSAARFHQVLHQRRQSSGAVRLIQRLMGLEAKMRQYQEGEAFLEVIESHGGPEAVDHLWRGPEWIPNLNEIRSPERWLRRVGELQAAV